jgi:aspartate aminotransferase-like enzyme
MQKRYLMAPGPTPVAPETLLAMAEPIIHHRSPQFSAILAEAEEGLKYVFQTKNDVLILVASGTGAMEGAVTNFLSAGDTALVVRGGKFGERWDLICKAYGVKTINLDVEWGKSIRPEVIESALKENPGIKAVYIQAHETSTGVKYPVEAIGKIVHQYPGTILVVDAISALGVYDIKTDDWHIDILVSGSQKALMLPPGLAFASVSDKAWELNKTATLPRFYFDFAKEKKNLAKNTGAYTSAVTLIIGLQQVITQIKALGLEACFARNKRLSEATKAGVKALGLKLYAVENPSEALTSILAPDGVNGQDVVKIMRDKYGVTIAGGQDQAKGKIFRISHMGYVNEFDVIVALSALEMTLKDLGYAVEMGAGVKAAELVFSS